MKSKKANMTVIDLLNMSDHEKQVVAKIVLAANTRVFPKGTLVGQNQGESLLFSHTLVRRERRYKEEKSHKLMGGDLLPTTRFEILLGSINSGSEGEIYDAMTCYVDNNKPPRLQLISKSQEKQRIIKSFFEKSLVKDERLKNEYSNIKNIPHLAAKKPTISHYGNFFVMRKLSGNDLFDKTLMETSNPKNNILSIADRFEISINVLYALHNQVVKHGLIHNDIKEENIMVDKKNNTHFVDYSLAALPNKQLQCGTPIYFSPEKAKDEPLTPDDDAYAAIIVIAKVWKIKLKVEKKYPNVNSWNMFDITSFISKNKEVFDFDNFDRYIDLDLSMKEEIKKIFIAGTALKKNKRMDVNEVIKQFEHIQLTYRSQVKRNNHSTG
ncbi:MAG: hypothetical protein A3F14_00270 [Gammaproteobacteria bacterium RIFCSPHIGHO2_12_FULL_43_28]|nr:MAG: hypothetical protein A3F14_00270 [Gammaproteobacteria bacterium RIFCSPHIGHO2_12_FULL_43_28]